MADPLNANPTILNASDLPTRRRRPSSQGSSKNSLGLFRSSVPSAAYLSDPFASAASSSLSSSDSDSDDVDHDDDGVEPIDEQEIYG